MLFHFSYINGIVIEYAAVYDIHVCRLPPFPPLAFHSTRKV